MRDVSRHLDGPGGQSTSPIASTAPMRHGAYKRPSRVRRFFAFLGFGISVILIATGSLVAMAYFDLKNSVVESEGIQLDDQIPPPQVLEGEFNILLVGSDARSGQLSAAAEDDDGVLNDVNILLHVNKAHTSATAVSIPRDMIVPIAECPNGAGGWTGPINNILSEGGLPCIVNTVENITGMDIPYAMIVQFDGVVDLSNVVGGVDICVSSRIEDPYQNIYLNPGMHTVSGVDALKFLRARYGVGDGSDLGRISNQQQFLSSLLRKLKSSGALTNPVALYEIAKAVMKDVSLSKSMNNLDTLIKMAGAVKDIPLETISFVQFPGFTGGEGEYEFKVEPDWEVARALFADIVADRPIQITGGTGRATQLLAPSTAAPNATEAPSATATDALLPGDINGQTANQVSCTVGRLLDDE